MPAPENFRKPDYIAFQNGEYLRFTMHFAGIHAGEATLEIKQKSEKIGGRDHFHVAIKGYSLPFFDAFYKVRDYYDTYIDKETLLPSVFLRSVNEGHYEKKESYIFNQKLKYVESNGKKIPVPENTFDIASAFYYLRCLDYSNIKTGDEVPVRSFFEEELFPLGVKYEGKTTIKTKIGKVRCMVFKPRLIEGRVFKDQHDMTIYVSDDKNQVPVRIESAVFLGYVRADLIEYRNFKYPFSALSR